MADTVILRSPLRALRRLRPPRPQLCDAILNGTVRRTRVSQAMANLQAQASAADVSASYRQGGAAAV